MVQKKEKLIDMAEKDSLDIIKLNGKNYTLWKFGVNLLLKSKGLSSFFDGTEAEPDKAEKPADWKNWDSNSSKVAVILLCSIEKTIHPLLINCSGPREMWIKLQNLYGESSEDAKRVAWEQFYAFRMKEGILISEQIEQLESICKKLEEANEKPSEAAVISKILSSLPPRFSTFRMAWECTTEASRTKDDLIARLIREEKRLLESEDTSSLALHTHTSNGKKNPNFKKKPVDKDSKKGKKKKIEELKQRTKCGYCKEVGHWVRECPKLAAKKRGEKEEEAHTGSAYSCDVSAFVSCTSNKDSDIWLADSGASRHMTHKKEFFTEISEPEEKFFIKTADDTHLPAIGVGTIRITEKVNGQCIKRDIRDVLLVPNLKRNLFSIASVTKKGFSFYAYGEYCEIRDTAGKILSIGTRHGELYKMCFEVELPVECNVVVSEKEQKLILCHERMALINIARF